MDTPPPVPPPNLPPDPQAAICCRETAFRAARARSQPLQCQKKVEKSANRRCTQAVGSRFLHRAALAGIHNVLLPTPFAEIINTGCAAVRGVHNACRSHANFLEHDVCEGLRHWICLLEGLHPTIFTAPVVASVLDSRQMSSLRTPSMLRCCHHSDVPHLFPPAHFVSVANKGAVKTVFGLSLTSHRVRVLPVALC